MGKPTPPKAPDPQQTATAQTGTNVSTAIANANLGNVNQVTPYGNLNYSQTGTYKWTDPTSGKQFDVPQFTATTSLTPEQQKILDQNNATNLNLATLGNTQSQRFGELLSDPFTLSGLPKAGDPSKIATPNYQQFGSGPQLQTSVANSGKIQAAIPDAGKIQTSVGSAGDITKTYGTDYGANVQQVQDALFDRVNPQLQKDQANLETSLVNQGIRRGSDAWNDAMGHFQQGVNDQRTSIVLQAGQEQSRLANLEAQKAGFQNAAQQQAYSQQMGNAQFANSAQAQQYGQNANSATFGNSAQQQQYQQNLSSADFGNNANQTMYQNSTSSTAANNALKDQLTNTQLAQFNAQNTTRQNAINEAYGVRNQNINEVLGLASGSQVQSPNFVNTSMPSIPTTDYAGIVQQDYANKTGAYNQQMSQYNSILGGLFGLGAAGVYKSDRRLKRDIRRIGTYRNGLPKYEFRYRHGGKRFIGLMSDDVRKVRPEAVMTIDGYDAVNYRKALA